MMGRLVGDQGKFFYDFRFDDHVPSDHLLRRGAALAVTARTVIQPKGSPPERTQSRGKVSSIKGRQTGHTRTKSRLT